MCLPTPLLVGTWSMSAHLEVVVLGVKRRVWILFTVACILGCNESVDFTKPPSSTPTAADPSQTATPLSPVLTRLATLLSTDENSSLINPELIDQVLADREAILAKLEPLVAAGVLTRQGTGAAILLCCLHESSGRDYIGKALSYGNRDQKIRVLKGLYAAWFADEGAEPDYRNFLLADAEFTRLLLSQLNAVDPEIVSIAIETCGPLNTHNQRAAMLSILGRESTPDRDRVLYWLSQGDLSEEILVSAIRYEPTIRESDFSGFLFRKFALSDNPSWRERATEHMKSMLASRPDDGAAGFHQNRSILLNTLAEAVAEEDLPWLKEALEIERGLYAKPLLIAYQRVAPDGKDKILEWLEVPDRQRVAIDAAALCFKGSADKEIVEALIGLVGRTDYVYPLCYSLAYVGGPEALDEFSKLRTKLSTDSNAMLSKHLQEMQVPTGE